MTTANARERTSAFLIPGNARITHGQYKVEREDKHGKI